MLRIWLCQSGSAPHIELEHGQIIVRVMGHILYEFAQLVKVSCTPFLIVGATLEFWEDIGKLLLV